MKTMSIEESGAKPWFQLKSSRSQLPSPFQMKMFEAGFGELVSLCDEKSNGLPPPLGLKSKERPLWLRFTASGNDEASIELPLPCTPVALGLASLFCSHCSRSANSPEE